LIYPKPYYSILLALMAQARKQVTDN